MSEFLEILTHGRRLQGAVKDLSVEELTSVQEKLNNIIEKRKEQEAELIKAQQEKLAKMLPQRLADFPMRQVDRVA